MTISLADIPAPKFFEDYEVQKMHPRERWYRMPEREHKSSKFLVTDDKREPGILRYGDFFYYNRTVVRIGYYWEPTDMPIEELTSAVLKEIYNQANSMLNRPWEMLHRLDSNARNYLTLPFANKEENPELISNMQCLAILLALDDNQKNLRPFVKRLIFRLRGEWYRDQPIKAEDSNIRTLWFVDTPQECIQADQVVRKNVGKRYSACYSGGEDGDYEGPSFVPWSTHWLMKITRNWMQRPYFLHVDDIDSKTTNNLY